MSQEVLNVRISDEQKAELERIAETQGATVSEIIRGLLDGELQTGVSKTQMTISEKANLPSPTEQLAELQQEQKKIADRIVAIKRAEEERRIAEQERQRQAALKQTEAQIRATLPELLNLRYKELMELLNSAIETSSAFARKYAKLIKKVEVGAREAEPLKKEFLRLGGNFDKLATSKKWNWWKASSNCLK